jgi:hypothetical protein
MDCRDMADGGLAPAHDTVGRDKLVEFHLQLKTGHQIGETFGTSSQVQDEQQLELDALKSSAVSCQQFGFI